jgi:hypothetical protein
MESHFFSSFDRKISLSLAYFRFILKASTCVKKWSDASLNDGFLKKINLYNFRKT